MQMIFSPQCLEYQSPGHPESPVRVKAAYEFLKQKGFDSLDGFQAPSLRKGKSAALGDNGSTTSLDKLGTSLTIEFVEPKPCKTEDILLVHSQALLDTVKTGRFFDADTPNLKGIFEYACLAAGAAVQAQEIALKRENAFSLMRPPGHHAGRDNLGGFCYFNNIAIAIAKALINPDFTLAKFARRADRLNPNGFKRARRGNPERISIAKFGIKIKKAAILDLDCHHGNGTQDIFLGNNRVLYISLHQSPLYPGTGLKSEKNCLNYPLPAGTDEKKYLAALARAIEEIKDFKPDLLGVSLGFDTYKDDPLTNFCLEVSTYRKIGEMVGSLGVTGFGVLEGGYSLKLGECLYEFILGWEGKKDR